jgi:hypothetical protein
MSGTDRRVPTRNTSSLFARASKEKMNAKKSIATTCKIRFVTSVQDSKGPRQMALWVNFSLVGGSPLPSLWPIHVGDCQVTATPIC